MDFYQRQKKYLKIAHRGYSEHYGDNNLVSFHKAMEYGFDMIEMDLQLTKDRHIVIYHDLYIHRTYIEDITLEDAEHKYNMVSLRKFFDDVYSVHPNMKMNFDLKGNNVFLVDKLMSLLKRYRVKMKNVYISSFNKKLVDLAYEYKVNKEFCFNIGFITCNVFNMDDLISLLNQVDFFVIDFNTLNWETVFWCNQNNIQVFVYTNTDEFTYSNIMRFNIDGIISNSLLPDAGVSES